MSELKNKVNEAYKEVENTAEGFWNKHKYCVIGGAASGVVGFIFGLIA